MDRRYSPITDLYGTTPPEKPRRDRGYGWLIVLLVVGGVFVTESLQIGMRLRSVPPPGFVGARLHSDETAYHAQERMAQDCWDYAVQHLQDKYPYGQLLPESPTVGVLKAPAIRIQCWPRLQRAWTQKESWKRTYRWNTDWIGELEDSLTTTLRHLWDSFRLAV